jgi:SAM-dependent methyltransferase
MNSKQTAAQLRRPSGEEAVDTAYGMNEANGSLNRRCIELLDVRDSESVLEIGPGNGAFAPNIIGSANNVSYAGIDWSGEMVAEARRINEELVTQGVADFHQGSSNHISFDSGMFDKVMAVHTLYFWDRPGDHFSEIRRVMKSSGMFCIAFGDRDFMSGLPFVSHGFELYDVAEVRTMLHAAGFHEIAVEQYREQGLSNSGEVVDKLINIITCRTPLAATDD